MPNETQALPPHPLDSAFTNCHSLRHADLGLERNQHYRNALAAAVDAYQEQQREIQQQSGKGWAGPSPESKARQAFLDAISSNRIGSAG